MKALGKKVIHVLLAIAVLTLVGFIVKPEPSKQAVSSVVSKQPVSDVVWGIYSPILMLFGVILALAVVVWIIKQATKLSSVNYTSGTVGRTFSRAGSIVPIILIWLVFIATILYLHPELWNVWYGDQSLFWISQAIFALLLLAFHGHKKLFYILITTATVVSFGHGFLGELKETGVITEKTKVLHPTQRKWKMCWQETDKAKGWDKNVKEGPCANDSGHKQNLVVDIKELNSSAFIFTVSWVEDRVFKERSRFYCDKIAQPVTCTWHQFGSKYKNSGKWSLTQKSDDLFIGWVSSKRDGQTYPLTLEAIN